MSGEIWQVASLGQSLSNQIKILRSRSLWRHNLAKFGPNFENASIFMKICTLHNWRMLISNLGVIFQNLGKKRDFRPNLAQILRMLWFSWKFAHSTIEGCWFQILGSFFKIWSKRGILGLIWPKFWECSDFPEILHLAQLKGADFNSWSHFSKFGQKRGF